MDYFVWLLLTNPKGFLVLIGLLAAYYVVGYVVLSLTGRLD